MYLTVFFVMISFFFFYSFVSPHLIFCLVLLCAWPHPAKLAARAKSESQSSLIVHCSSASSLSLLLPFGKRVVRPEIDFHDRNPAFRPVYIYTSDGS